MDMDRGSQIDEDLSTFIVFHRQLNELSYRST